MTTSRMSRRYRVRVYPEHRERRRMDARVAATMRARRRSCSLARQAELKIAAAQRAQGVEVSPPCLGCCRPVKPGTYCRTCLIEQPVLGEAGDA